MKTRVVLFIGLLMQTAFAQGSEVVEATSSARPRVQRLDTALPPVTLQSLMRDNTRFVLQGGQIGNCALGKTTMPSPNQLNIYSELNNGLFMGHSHVINLSTMPKKVENYMSLVKGQTINCRQEYENVGFQDNATMEVTSTNAMSCDKPMPGIGEAEYTTQTKFKAYRKGKSIVMSLETTRAGKTITKCNWIDFNSDQPPRPR